MATKASAIQFREAWLSDLERVERSPVPEEWSHEERDEYLSASRAKIRADLRALAALPDDASDEAVRAAVAA